MATEISVSLFEKNAKIYNKKGLRRRYSSFPERENEYIKVPPLGLTSKFVFEVTVDKSAYQGLADLFRSEGYQVLGARNLVFIDKVISDYENNSENYKKFEEGIQNLKKDREGILQANKDYDELAEDDVRFYVYPYNENVTTICEFLETSKNKIQDFAKKEDVTIIMKIDGHTNLINGYIGFNFFDAENKEEDVVVDYSSNIVVNTDFKDPGKTIIAAFYLAGLAKDPEDLELMNAHIFADNIIYNKE